VPSFRLAHADDDLNLPPRRREDEALRVWLSDQQWMSILERIERQARTPDEPETLARIGEDERREPADPRRPLSARCLIRVGSHGDEAGTYLVRTRNISAGGLGFVHNQDMRTGTRCTIALQLHDGKGMIVSGRVAWCREILQLEVDEATFEIGVQFDQPIALDAFGGHVA